MRGFHLSNLVHPAEPTSKSDMTNKQQSRDPNVMKLTSCTGVWAMRGAGGAGPKGACPNGANGGAAWGAKGGAGTCAANIGPWRTFIAS